MKIVITVNTYYPLTDGVQAVTQYEAEGLSNSGHDVTVVTVKYPGQKSFEKHNGVKIIRHNIKTKHAFYVGDLAGYRDLITRLCKDADVLLNICTQTATTETLYPILDKLPCKKVLYLHGIYDFSWHRFNFNSISAFMHKLWNNVRWRYDYLKNAKYLKKYSDVIQLHKMDNSNLFFKEKFGITPKVISNAAEPAFFNVLEKNIKNRKVNKYAICVSNYIPRKNQELILEAFYKTKDKNIGLVLIGSKKTPYYYKLKQIKTKLDNLYGKRKVEILTNVPRNEIPLYVKNASIYLLGSEWEAFPISIVESMASGVPYISTDVGIVKYLPGGIIANSKDDIAFWIDLLNSNLKVAENIGLVGRNYALSHLSESVNVKYLQKILGGK